MYGHHSIHLFGLTMFQGPPHVLYAQLKYYWANGDRDEALGFLDNFTRRLSQDLGVGEGQTRPAELVDSGQLGDFTKLLARCYYKQAEWSMALQDDWGSVRSHCL